LAVDERTTALDFDDIVHILQRCSVRFSNA
jgi:hypothetical protein